MGMFMAVNGVYDSSNISNLYNSIFGIGSSKDTGNSFGLSDLTMIQNGSYGKLMKAYYATDNAFMMMINKALCISLGIL